MYTLSSLSNTASCMRCEPLITVLCHWRHCHPLLLIRLLVPLLALLLLGYVLLWFRNILLKGVFLPEKYGHSFNFFCSDCLQNLLYSPTSPDISEVIGKEQGREEDWREEDGREEDGRRRRREEGRVGGGGLNTPVPCSLPPPPPLNVP